ncbi:MAG: erythromycin esterase family protein [Pyrinomonadaceae bacterium]
MKFCIRFVCLIVCCGLISFFAFSQSNIPQVSFKESIIKLKSTEANFEDFSDLEKFGEMIGDAQVVQLGEFNHGDGKAFQARIRLVKYLHQKLGFNVLAFESGLVEVENARFDLKNGKPTYTSVSKRIYDAWANSAQAMPLFDYIKQSYGSQNSLDFIGFDPQFSSDLSAKLIKEFLMDDLSGASRSDIKLLLEMLEVLQGYGAKKIDDSKHLEYRKLLRQMKSLIGSSSKGISDRSEKKKNQILMQVAENIDAMELSIYYRSKGPKITLENINTAVNAPELIKASNVRDEQMADNIMWILREYKKGRKIIIWGANSHLANFSQRKANSEQQDNETLLRYIPMGEHLKKSLGKRLFTILSVSFKGEWALAGVSYQKGVYKPAEKDTLAYLLNQENLNTAILDLDHFYRSNSGLSSPVTVRSNWTVNAVDDLRTVCDALLYFDEMTPSTLFTVKPQ